MSLRALKKYFMLLHAFTWQSFLIAALVFSLVWLGVVLLVFYRKELFALLSGRVADEEGLSGPLEPLRHAWQDEFEEGDDSFDEGLLGPSVLPEGVSILAAEDFGFVGAGRDTDEVPVDTALLQGDVFDLMEQVKPFLEDAALDKGGFIAAVNAQVRDFPRLMRSDLLGTFYEVLAEQVSNSAVLGFSVAVAELQGAL
jgi:hypothetical protein